MQSNNEEMIKTTCDYCGTEFEYRRTNSFKIRNMCGLVCARKKFASNKIVNRETTIALHRYGTVY